MQLLVYISNNPDVVSPVFAHLMEKGISGATVVDAKGMLTALDESSVEPPPIFGSLRRFINPEHESGKMMLFVLKDEDVPIVKNVIHQDCGSLKQPNTGVMFTVPVMEWEGVSHK